MIHVPVLLKEVMEKLIVNPSGIYFDGTLGFGGHSSYLLSQLKDDSILIGTDKDINAIDYCKEKFADDPRLKIYNTGFTDINLVSKIEFIDKFDGIFADLGVSSFQLDDKESGFMHRDDAPLDLRMDKTKGLSVSDVLNKFDEKEIADIIYKYGEEPASRRISRKIVEYRKENKIERTSQLKDLITSVVNRKVELKTLSRTFQALRIYVNDELDELKDFLIKATELLKPGGRLVILSYHSLEDRIVKEHFKYESIDCVCPHSYPICVCDKVSRMKIITRKPTVPSEEEIKENFRARSAKLRVAERNAEK